MSSPDPEFKKYFPADFELETPRVIIRPMKADDVESFLRISHPGDTWKYFYKDLGDKQEMKKWVADSLREISEGKRMAFTVVDKDTREVCGSSSYGSISFYDQRIEIGWSWLGDEYIGMGVNKHVKFALISYAFEVMKMERVEATFQHIGILSLEFHVDKLSRPLL